MYSDTVSVKSKSVLSGETEGTASLDALKKSEIGILRAFAEDNDIQEITVASTNMGFVRTFTKQYEASR